jgi:hypothetical protein
MNNYEWTSAVLQVTIVLQQEQNTIRTDKNTLRHVIDYVIRDEMSRLRYFDKPIGKVAISQRVSPA